MMGHPPTPPAEPIDRTPALTPAGAEVIHRMREHGAAPIFRNESGHRLFPEDVEAWHREAPFYRCGPVENDPDVEPEWMPTYLARVGDLCPIYREHGGNGDLRHLPTTHRGDLSRQMPMFVPDDQPLGNLINFRTTGTTGHPLLLPSLPRVAARYLHFHQRALDFHGVPLPTGPCGVGVILIGHQEKCFTYTSVTPALGERGLAKINLHPHDWRKPTDRATWLDSMAADIYTGDPLSLSVLADLDTRHKPLAILSTSMALQEGLRRHLQARFKCPVIDIYSMNEAGPIGATHPEIEGHVLLQPCMYVEILDEEGQRMKPGERGEITLTGGFNDCLPLRRYRTGDFASINRVAGHWVLQGLEGRAPVRYRGADGLWHNNIEVTHALGRLPLIRFTAHQSATGHVTVRYQGVGVSAGQLETALAPLFSKAITAEPCSFHGMDKVRQYTSDLPGNQPEGNET